MNLRYKATCEVVPGNGQQNSYRLTSSVNGNRNNKSIRTTVSSPDKNWSYNPSVPLRKIKPDELEYGDVVIVVNLGKKHNKTGELFHWTFYVHDQEHGYLYSSEGKEGVVARKGEILTQQLGYARVIGKLKGVWSKEKLGCHLDHPVKSSKRIHYHTSEWCAKVLKGMKDFKLIELPSTVSVETLVREMLHKAKERRRRVLVALYRQAYELALEEESEREGQDASTGSEVIEPPNRKEPEIDKNYDGLLEAY